MIVEYVAPPGTQLMIKGARLLVSMAPVVASLLVLTVPEKLSAGVWGMPKFVMQQSDDRFSTDGMTVWTSKWNRISKRSTAGGRHIDSDGVFLEPFVLLNRGDGKLRSLGLTFRNAFWRDTLTGAPLSIGTPQRITFLTGEGDPLVLKISDPKHETQQVPSCDRVTNICTSKETDRGGIDLTIEQYARIMNATALVAKIEGSDRD